MPKLPMTAGEICCNYREAKNKGAQIRILAELNDCTVQRIKDILKDGAETLPRGPLPKGKKIEPQKENKEAAWHYSPKAQAPQEAPQTEQTVVVFPEEGLQTTTPPKPLSLDAWAKQRRRDVKTWLIYQIENEKRIDMEFVDEFNANIHAAGGTR